MARIVSQNWLVTWRNILISSKNIAFKTPLFYFYWPQCLYYLKAKNGVTDTVYESVVAEAAVFSLYNMFCTIVVVFVKTYCWITIGVLLLEQDSFISLMTVVWTMVWLHNGFEFFLKDHFFSIIPVGTRCLFERHLMVSPTTTFVKLTMS